jgi:hypothetical protein
MLRREFALGLASLALAPNALGAPSTERGPIFYLAARAKARVFILGFGESKDDSWATPLIRRAFDSSADLWLETGREVDPDPDAKSKVEQLEREPAGRTFFDELNPDVRQRAVEYCARLGIAQEQIGQQRPWAAYYTINSAYWAKAKTDVELKLPDAALKKWAADQGKPISYEQPTRLAGSRFLASMPEAAQNQWIVFLLDFLDDQTAGRNKIEFDWQAGNAGLAERAVQRMRTRTPALYQIMQVERNAWWAESIDRLLATGGTHFVGIGQMHVVGPDGIPNQLLRRGIVKPSNLFENPQPTRLG